jgi:hypothetical protein
MARLAERIIETVMSQPGISDRELTDRLPGQGVRPQTVNQVARRLDSSGQLVRRKRPDGRFGNYPVGGAEKVMQEPAGMIEPPPGDFLSEDDAKRKLQAWLEDAGWRVAVVWGRGRGLDMEARRGDSRWVIEVKGQGTLDAMRVNYFLAVLGELLQRMDDSHARYSIALPDLPQFRRLWQRLPNLAKERTRISALFVSVSGQVEEVALASASLDTMHLQSGT